MNVFRYQLEKYRGREKEEGGRRKEELVMSSEE